VKNAVGFLPLASCCASNALAEKQEARSKKQEARSKKQEARKADTF